MESRSRIINIFYKIFQGVWISYSRLGKNTFELMKKFALLHKLKFLLLFSVDLSEVETVVTIVDITEFSPNHRTRICINTINSLEIPFLFGNSVRIAVLLGDAVNFSKNNGTLHVFSGRKKGKCFLFYLEQGTKNNLSKNKQLLFLFSFVAKCKSHSRTKFPKL